MLCFLSPKAHSSNGMIYVYILRCHRQEERGGGHAVLHTLEWWRGHCRSWEGLAPRANCVSFLIICFLFYKTRLIMLIKTIGFCFLQVPRKKKSM